MGLGTNVHFRVASACTWSPPRCSSSCRVVVLLQNCITLPRNRAGNAERLANSAHSPEEKIPKMRIRDSNRRTARECVDVWTCVWGAEKAGSFQVSSTLTRRFCP